MIRQLVFVLLCEKNKDKIKNKKNLIISAHFDNLRVIGVK